MSEQIFNPQLPKSMEEWLRLRDDAIRGVVNAYEAQDPAAFDRATSTYENAKREIDAIAYGEPIDEALKRLDSGDPAAVDYVRRNGIMDFMIGAALGELDG
jgi:hypothetical protein